MKTLTALVIVQLAVMILLVVKVTSLENAAPTSLPDVKDVAGGNVVTLPSAEARDTTVSFPEDRLREIVREELAAQLESGGVSTAETASVPVPVDDADYQVRREMVAQSLEYFATVGEISETEMANLQTQISRLNKEDREEMLKLLVRQLNTSAIDGRL